MSFAFPSQKITTSTAPFVLDSSRPALVFVTSGLEVPFYLNQSRSGIFSLALLENPSALNMKESYQTYFSLKASGSSPLVTALEFEWIQPPKVDFFQNTLTFSFLLRKETKEYWYYAKQIYLTSKGGASIEIDQPWQPQLQSVFEALITKITLNQKYIYDKALSPNIPQLERFSREMLLPKIDSSMERKLSQKTSSFLEQNRKAIGIFFLVLAILFFLFFPKRKED